MYTFGHDPERRVNPSLYTKRHGTNTDRPVERHLAFTRYCYYQYGMVYSIQTGVRKGSRILPNNRAIVLHQGGQCRWAGGMKGWLIRPQQPRSQTISCKGQSVMGCA